MLKIVRNFFIFFLGGEITPVTHLVSAIYKFPMSLHSYTKDLHDHRTTAPFAHWDAGAARPERFKGRTEDMLVAPVSKDDFIVN